MPGPTKLVLFEDKTGLVVQEDPTQVLNLITVAKRAEGSTGFARLTAAGGKTIFVAVDKILYIEPEEQ